MLLRYYRHIMALSAPFLDLLIRLRARRGLEEDAHRPERSGISALPRPQGRVLWIHAASVGEMRSVLPLVDRLLEKNADLTCLVTTVTVTAARMVRRMQNDRFVHQYAPFDHAKWVARFLEHWKPDAALWVESELWPNTLDAVHARGIPLMMVNGRLSQRSFDRWNIAGFTRKAVAHVLSLFDICHAQSADDAQRLTTLGARNVPLSGNMKYSASPLPADETALAMLRTQIGERPVILFASTHDGEELYAARVTRELLETYPDILTIIMPRHPARSETVAGAVDEENLALSVRSKNDVIDRHTNIYLADTMGEAGLFFRLASIVFMGNSLTRSPGGGHNPVEPAQLGCAIVYGPNMWNFVEIDRDLRRAGGAIMEREERELTRSIKHLMDNPAERQKLADAARAFAVAQNGVLDGILNSLRPYLAKAGITA